MRAVNLIPAEERRGAGGAGGRSGGAAYALLGGLAVLVALVAAFTLLGRQADTARADAARLTAQASTAEAQAASLQGYAGFASLRDKRVQTVTELAASRYDWAHTLRELARVVPADVTLDTLNATVAPGAISGDGSGSGLRSAISAPAIELEGCSASQDQVASMMSAMRRIDGVTRVSLESSQKSDTGATGDATSTSTSADASGSGCEGAAGDRPAFSLVVFLTAPAALPATTATATP